MEFSYKATSSLYNPLIQNYWASIKSHALYWVISCPGHGLIQYGCHPAFESLDYPWSTQMTYTVHIVQLWWITLNTRSVIMINYSLWHNTLGSVKNTLCHFFSFKFKCPCVWVFNLIIHQDLRFKKWSLKEGRNDIEILVKHDNLCLIELLSIWKRIMLKLTRFYKN